MPLSGASLLHSPQSRQNTCFLAALGRAGNARLAVRELGLNRSIYTKRRAKDPAFAADWAAALGAADAALVENPQLAFPPDALRGYGELAAGGRIARPPVSSEANAERSQAATGVGPAQPARRAS